MQNLIYFYDAAGTQVGVKSATKVPTTDWTALTVTVAAPEGAVVARTMTYNRLHTLFNREIGYLPLKIYKRKSSHPTAQK